MLREALELGRELPPEQEDGSNVEYKWKLHERDPVLAASLVRFQHYCSQLAWRLSCGPSADHNECRYLLGVDDSGKVVGCSVLDLDRSLGVLQQMCRVVRADIILVDRIDLFQYPLHPSFGVDSNVIHSSKFACEVVIHRGRSSAVPSNALKKVRRRCVVVVGPTQVGKSTLVGTLGARMLDVPAGTNRLRLMKHRHELISGRTTSTSVDYLLYPTSPQNTDGDRSAERRRPSYSEEDLFEVVDSIRFGDHTDCDQKPTRHDQDIVQLCDVPGDARYLKAVFSALTLPNVDAVLLLSPSNDMSTEEAAYCDSLRRIIVELRLPVIDICRADYDCVTGHGLEAIKARLHRELFHPREHDNEGSEGHHVVLQVEHVYRGPDIGTVASGILLEGTLHVHDVLYHPCIFRGDKELEINCQPVDVRTMHSMRRAIQQAGPEQPLAFTTTPELDAATLLKGTVLSTDAAYLKGNLAVISRIPLKTPLSGQRVMPGADALSSPKGPKSPMTTGHREGLVFVQGNRLVGTFSADTIQLSAPLLAPRHGRPIRFIALLDSDVLSGCIPPT
jgi:GTPase